MGRAGELVMYDLLYQKWVSAIHEKDYDLADKLREEFERKHGLTIIAVGDMPVEGITTMPLPAFKWQKKYGSPKLAAIIAEQDSKVGKGYHIHDRGYHD
jgi:hypothetical protein